MQTPAVTEERFHPLGFIARWWSNWTRRNAASRELECCGASEIAHLAHDLGVSSSELRTLAGRWPDAADLLGRRMKAHGLDDSQIGQSQPEVLRDLQRVCGQCAAEGRCEHDLNRDPQDRAWRDYCPNVVTLDALRSEERDHRLMRTPKWP
jgi:hypothetical protein